MSGRGRTGVDDPARAVAMCRRFKSGETMQAIATDYQISRERVRQILKKYGGLVGADGGEARAAQIKRNKMLAARDAKSLERYGCTFAQHKMLIDMAIGMPIYRSPCRAYVGQRNNAYKRGIEWKLTLWEWWCIWEKSGKWGCRGRGQGGYVMARKGDAGGYEVGNVFICLATENNSETPQKKSGLPRGVSKRVVGNYVAFVAHKMIGGEKHRLGSFKTPDAAHNAYLAFTG